MGRSPASKDAATDAVPVAGRQLAYPSTARRSPSRLAHRPAAHARLEWIRACGQQRISRGYSSKATVLGQGQPLTVRFASALVRRREIDQIGQPTSDEVEDYLSTVAATLDGVGSKMANRCHSSLSSACAFSIR